MKNMIYIFVLSALVFSCNKGSSLPSEASAALVPEQSIGTVTTPSGTTTNPSWTEQFLELVNDHRASLGLGLLTHDGGLDQIVIEHSQDMATGKVAFGHTGFSSRCSEGYAVLGGGNLCAENVAMGQTSPKAAYDAWMSSSGHRANIESSRVNHTGFGYARSSTGTYYWTQIFIER